MTGAAARVVSLLEPPLRVEAELSAVSSCAGNGLELIGAAGCSECSGCVSSVLKWGMDGSVGAWAWMGVCSGGRGLRRGSGEADWSSGDVVADGQSVVGERGSGSGCIAAVTIVSIAVVVRAVE